MSNCDFAGMTPAQIEAFVDKGIRHKAGDKPQDYLNSEKRTPWSGWLPPNGRPIPNGSPTHWMPLPHGR